MSSDAQRATRAKAMCEGKQRIPDEAHAQRAVVHVMNNRGWPMRYYECPQCGFFHLSSKWSSDPEDLTRQIQSHPDFEWQKRAYEAMRKEGLVP